MLQQSLIPEHKAREGGRNAREVQLSAESDTGPTRVLPTQYLPPFLSLVGAASPISDTASQQGNSSREETILMNYRGEREKVKMAKRGGVGGSYVHMKVAAIQLVLHFGSRFKTGQSRVSTRAGSNCRP